MQMQRTEHTLPKGISLYFLLFVFYVNCTNCIYHYMYLYYYAYALNNISRCNHSTQILWERAQCNLYLYALTSNAHMHSKNTRLRSRYICPFRHIYLKSSKLRYIHVSRLCIMRVLTSNDTLSAQIVRGSPSVLLLYLKTQFYLYGILSTQHSSRTATTGCKCKRNKKCIN